MKFRSEDFRLVRMVESSQIGFVARKDLPVDDVDEYIADVRKQAAAYSATTSTACVSTGPTRMR